MATRAPESSQLVRACLQLLALRGTRAWRNNSGAASVGGRYVRFGDPGSPDIFGILAPSGRLLAVECKTGQGRLNPAQRAWMASAEAAGAACLVVRSVAELERWLAEENTKGGAG
jgi:hypothetical protein